MVDDEPNILHDSCLISDRRKRGAPLKRTLLLLKAKPHATQVIHIKPQSVDMGAYSGKPLARDSLNIEHFYVLSVKEVQYCQHKRYLYYDKRINPDMLRRQNGGCARYETGSK